MVSPGCGRKVGPGKASGALRFRRAPSLRMCEATVAVSPKLWPRCAAVSPKLWLHYLVYPFRSEFLNFMSGSRSPRPRGGLAEGGHVDARVANVAREVGNVKSRGQPGGDLALMRAWACSQVRRTALMGDSTSD